MEDNKWRLSIENEIDSKKTLRFKHWLWNNNWSIIRVIKLNLKRYLIIINKYCKWKIKNNYSIFCSSNRKIFNSNFSWNKIK